MVFFWPAVLGLPSTGQRKKTFFAQPNLKQILPQSHGRLAEIIGGLLVTELRETELDLIIKNEKSICQSMDREFKSPPVVGP